MNRARSVFTACALVAAVALLPVSCACPDEKPEPRSSAGLPGPGGSAFSLDGDGGPEGLPVPEDVEALETANEKILALNAEGLNLYRDGKLAEAAKKFEEALVLDPEHETLLKNTVRAYYWLGLSRSRSGENGKALDAFRHAQRYAPDDPKLQLAIATVLFNEKRYAEARAACEAVFAMKSVSRVTYGAAQKLLGEILLATGDPHGALREWALYLEEHADARLAARFVKLKKETRVEENLVERGTARFTLRFDGAENPEVGEAVLNMLEDAYTQIGGALHFYPEEPVTVILYPEQTFYYLTGSYGWVSALYDGKIKIPVKDFEKHRAKIERTVRHEFTHALIYRITSACPAWLHEGIAQHFEEVDLVKTESALASEKKYIISFNDMPASFTKIGDMKRVARYYRQSYSFVSYLESSYGISRIAALLEALSDKKLDEAFRHVYNRSLTGLEKDWMESLP